MSQSLLIALIVIVAIVVIAIVAVLARTAGKQRLRALPDESKDRYAHSWRAIETRFIDDPRGAVQEADKTAVMILGERGGNVSDENHMPDELRKARAALRDERGSTNDTEGLRRAMQHYKAIVDDAVGSSRLEPEHGRREMAS
ncbi:MAG TPA: hypothetical protein VFR33_05630 [Candidatus Dormibacteraeota bacterium]|nr:hypothetical protein [Candidatus Dormibacteraeota bacterium]